MMRKYPVRFGGRGRCVLSRGASPRPNRDLKALGLYTSRALSFAGVEYDVLRHELTPGQIEIYDTYANAWGVILQNMEAALEMTGVVDGLENATLNSGAKASARSRLESTKQRFFGQVLLSMKLPTVIAAVEQHLKAEQSSIRAAPCSTSPPSGARCRSTSSPPISVAHARRAPPASTSRPKSRASWRSIRRWS